MEQSLALSSYWPSRRHSLTIAWMVRRREEPLLGTLSSSTSAPPLHCGMPGSRHTDGVLLSDARPGPAAPKRAPGPCTWPRLCGRGRAGLARPGTRRILLGPCPRGRVIRPGCAFACATTAGSRAGFQVLKLSLDLATRRHRSGQSRIARQCWHQGRGPCDGTPPGASTRRWFPPGRYQGAPSPHRSGSTHGRLHGPPNRHRAWPGSFAAGVRDTQNHRAASRIEQPTLSRRGVRHSHRHSHGRADRRPSESPGPKQVASLAVRHNRTSKGISTEAFNDVSRWWSLSSAPSLRRGA